MKKKDKIISVESGEAKHSFGEREKEAYIDYINNILGNEKDDPELNSLIPINIHSDEIYDIISKGVLLCKLINKCFENVIDLTKLNKNPKNTFEMNENHDLCIAGAKTIGCNVINIGGKDLVDKKPHLVLGLLWQIIKMSLLKQVSNNQNLLNKIQGETGELVENQAPEVILLHWFNLHLKRAGYHKTVKNFNVDIQDSEAYTLLLSQIVSSECNLSTVESILREKDLEKRAELLLQVAERIHCRKFVTAKDIVEGNPRLNLAFVATLFNSFPSLGPTNEEIALEKAKKLEEKVDQLQTEKDHLENQLKENQSISETINVKLQNINQQYEVLKEEKIKLQEKIEIMNKILQDTNKKTSEEKKELEEKLEQMNTNLENTQQQKESLGKQLQNAWNELDNEKNQNILEKEKLNKIINEKNNEINELKKIIEELKNKIERLESELNTKVNQINNLNDELVSVKNAMIRAESLNEQELEKLKGLLLSDRQKEGWLFILSDGVLKKWKRRFFILKDTMLVWYKDEKGAQKKLKPAGIVYVDMCRIYQLDEKEIKRSYCFELNGEGNILRIAANDEEDQKSWLNEIKKAKKKKVGQSSASLQTLQKSDSKNKAKP